MGPKLLAQRAFFLCALLSLSIVSIKAAPKGAPKAAPKGAPDSSGKGRRSIDRRTLNHPNTKAIPSAQSTNISNNISNNISKKNAHRLAAPFIAKAKEAYTSHPPKFAEAIFNYKEALKIEDDVYTRMRLAQMYKYSQRYPEAEAEYEKVRKYYQDHPEATRTFAIGPPRGASSQSP